MKSSPTIEIVSDKERWRAVLKGIGNYDFYHTYEYNQLSKKENEVALLFVFNESITCIAIPFIIRPIKNESFFDATSPYGYGGPISKNINLKWDNTNFKIGLVKFFKEYKIISAFSSLNPYISNQKHILDNFGEINNLGSVVNIDLTKDLDEQRRQYSKITKRKLNKIKNICTVRISKKEEDVLKFMELYYRTMDRVNAKDKYYFNKEYFLNFLQSTDFEVKVICVSLKETNEVISSALMVVTNNKIVQYHLSGTSLKYLLLSPLRLIIDEMRILATKQGYTNFNLGGGVNSNNDSLFQFKSTFSKDFRDFHIWKYVCNEDVYNRLVSKNSGAYNGSNIDFFPSYRYKEI